jgi:hypothetical protein
MRDIIVDTAIAAPADRVWRILTELPSYPEWNPFIRRARGSLAVGGTVRVRVRAALGIPLRFRARIVACEPGRELRWRGQVGGEWLAMGEHSFRIEPAGEGQIRFVQEEHLGGLLPRLFHGLVAREARRGFAAMNRELAARAERAEAAPDPASRAPS